MGEGDEAVDFCSTRNGVLVGKQESGNCTAMNYTAMDYTAINYTAMSYNAMSYNRTCINTNHLSTQDRIFSCLMTNRVVIFRLILKQILRARIRRRQQTSLTMLSAWVHSDLETARSNTPDVTVKSRLRQGTRGL